MEPMFRATAVMPPKARMEGSCLELALEGERLCKLGDYKAGVRYLQAAVGIGTDDLRMLSAIYSQLGNAHFTVANYREALKYHGLDLEVASLIGDKVGLAKALGNVGNAMKVLGDYGDAIVILERHLRIAREIKNKVLEMRALYNLGNAYHAKGKQMGRGSEEHQEPGEFSPEGAEILRKAVYYYEENLKLVREVGDRAAQGRACGNLGNALYLLGEFQEAIVYHDERLRIAKEFGDKQAERRAYTNLGNAHIFLGEFLVAADYYQKALQIARQSGDQALEAQACYSLGQTYTLLRDFELAIEYHVLHLRLARKLHDELGESRSNWALGNAHENLRNYRVALEYTARHYELSKEFNDKAGVEKAESNIAKLKGLLRSAEGANFSDNTRSVNGDSRSGRLTTSNRYEDDDDNKHARHHLVRHDSMDRMELVKLTPEQVKEGASLKPKLHRSVQKSFSSGADLSEKMKENRVSTTEQKRPLTADSAKRQSTDTTDEDSFFDLLSRYQSRRINDQRCSFEVADDPLSVGAIASCEDDKENTEPKASDSTSYSNDEFLELVAVIQASRMNDQRAYHPDFPGLHNGPAVIAPYISNRRCEGDNLDEQFFEILMRCQNTRIDDQRTELPVEQRPAPTVPDDDFFVLVQRLQSSRLDEQRSCTVQQRQQERQTGPALTTTPQQRATAAAVQQQQSTTGCKAVREKKKGKQNK